MGAAAPTADPLATERRDLPMTTIDLTAFAANNNLNATDAKNIETMIEIYRHRLDLDTLRVTDGGWIVADLTCSERTASKFAGRLKSEVRASFLGSDCAGIKVDEI